jgi:hypothetical protein
MQQNIGTLQKIGSCAKKCFVFLIRSDENGWTVPAETTSALILKLGSATPTVLTFTAQKSWQVTNQLLFLIMAANAQKILTFGFRWTSPPG